MDLGEDFWSEPFVHEESHYSSMLDEANLYDPGLSSEVFLNENSGSTVHISQSPNTSSVRALRKSVSSLSETERAARKRKRDQEYRKRVKNNKQQLESSVENLAGECAALKKENQSLKEGYDSMNQTLTNKEKEFDQLWDTHLQLKRDLDNQSALSDTLSKLLADPSRVEIEKLKNENAWLRNNANLNICVPELLEVIAKLQTENKVLKVQNDALCAKMIKCQRQVAGAITTS